MAQFFQFRLILILAKSKPMLLNMNWPANFWTNLFKWNVFCWILAWTKNYQQQSQINSIEKLMAVTSMVKMFFNYYYSSKRSFLEFDITKGISAVNFFEKFISKVFDTNNTRNITCRRKPSHIWPEYFPFCLNLHLAALSNLFFNLWELVIGQNEIYMIL